VDPLRSPREEFEKIVAEVAGALSLGETPPVERTKRYGYFSASFTSTGLTQAA